MVTSQWIIFITMNASKGLLHVAAVDSNPISKSPLTLLQHDIMPCVVENTEHVKHCQINWIAHVDAFHEPVWNSLVSSAGVHTETFNGSGLLPDLSSLACIQ